MWTHSKKNSTVKADVSLRGFHLNLASSRTNDLTALRSELLHLTEGDDFDESSSGSEGEDSVGGCGGCAVAPMPGEEYAQSLPVYNHLVGRGAPGTLAQQTSEYSELGQSRRIVPDVRCECPPRLERRFAQDLGRMARNATDPLPTPPERLV